MKRNKGQNVSLLGALSSQGLMAMVTRVGNVETPLFVTCVAQILAPQLSSGAIHQTVDKTRQLVHTLDK